MTTPYIPSHIRVLGRIRLNTVTLLGLVAVLAPVGYVVGRGTADSLAVGALGMLMGIPVGLFFGSLQNQVGQTIPAISHATRTEVLAKIKAELTQNQALFMARKGSTNLYARIAYLTPFWTAANASGQVATIQDSNLLQAVSTAYYWLNQASHIELLAYEAKYAQEPASDSLIRATHLISDVRLLDGQLENALSAAISALDSALTAH